MSRTPKRQAGLCYVINSFDRGGAEFGLLSLIEGGLFADIQVQIVLLVRGTGGLDGQLPELGVTPTVLLDRPQMRVWHLLPLWMRLRKVLRHSAPDIVIASLPQANLLARLCLLFRKTVLFVSFEHNTHLAKRAYEVGFRLTSWRVDWAFADSRTTLEVALRRLYSRRPRGRRKVIPLVSFATPARVARYVAGPRFHVINAARFTPTKNQASLIRAVARLVDEGRPIALTLYGDGPELAACRALTSELQLGEHVSFPGFVSGWAERPADLFVLSSEHEGLCLVVLEAMHAGIPVAAPLVGGIGDHAAPCLAVQLRATTPTAIAEGIAAVMDGGDVAARTASAAAMVDEQFGRAAVHQIYRDTNRELLTAVREWIPKTNRVGEVRRLL